MTHRGQIVLDAINHFHAELLMGHFAAAELQMNLHLVALVEEFLRVPDLGHVVVFVDVYAELDLLYPPGRVLLLLLLLGEIVAKLSEVDDPTYGRLCSWGNFDQIETDRASVPESFLDAHDSHLLVGNTIDHPHLPGTNAFVNANIP